MKRVPLVPALVALALPVRCATQPTGAPGLRGFWGGLRDRAIAPLSFIVALFAKDTRICALPNPGSGYDFGWPIGMTCRAGASPAARRT